MYRSQTLIIYYSILKRGEYLFIRLKALSHHVKYSEVPL